MKKDKFIEVTPDGKREIEEGKEPLKKPNYSLDAAQSNYQDSINEESRKKISLKAFHWVLITRSTHFFQLSHKSHFFEIPPF